MFNNKAFPLFCFPFIYHFQYNKPNDIETSVTRRCDKATAMLAIDNFDLREMIKVPNIVSDPSTPLQYRNEIHKRIFDPIEHATWALLQSHPFDINSEVDKKVIDLVELRNKGPEYVKLYRIFALEYWKVQAEELRPQQVEWANKLDDNVKKVIGHLHIPLWARMLKSTSSKDVNLFHDLTNGMPLAGSIPPSYNWTISDEPEPSFNASDWVNKDEPCELPRPVMKEKHFMWDQAIQECRDVTMMGPFDPNSLGSKGRLIAARHIVVQPDKKRPCDNFTLCLTNLTVQLIERITMITVERFMANVLYIRKHLVFLLRPSLLGFKGDHATAFRQIAIKPSHRPLFTVALVSPLLNKMHFFEHLGLPFGGTACPQQYSRISHSICLILMEIFIIYVECFIDDLFGVEDEELAESTWNIFMEVHKMLGIRLKEKKLDLPDFKQVILGLLCTFGLGPYTVEITEERRQKMIKELTGYLTETFISQGDASSFAGKVEFAQKGIWGKSVRPFLQPFYARANGRMSGWTRNMDWACRWLRSLLIDVKPNVIEVSLKLPHFILYTDARGSPPHAGWVSFDKKYGIKGATYSSIPLDNDMAVFLQGDADMMIAMVEAWGVLLALNAVKYPKGSLITVYIDNEHCLSFIRKGYSPDFRAAWIAGAIWRIAALNSWRIWFTRVFTDSNISDGPSREDFAIMNKIEANWVESIAFPAPTWE